MTVFYLNVFLAAIFAFAAIGAFLSNDPDAGSSLIKSLLVTAFFSYNAWRIQKKREEENMKTLPAFNEDNPALIGDVPQNMQKALDDYNHIHEIVKTIKDPFICKTVNRLQHTARNLILYLKKRPEKISLASRFIEYYQDKTLNLLKQYQELMQTGLHHASIDAAVDQLKDTLADLVSAYEEQFARVLNDQLMNLDAEMKVMNQVMKSEGIDTEKKNEFDELKQSEKINADEILKSREEIPRAQEEIFHPRQNPNVSYQYEIQRNAKEDVFTRYMPKPRDLNLLPEELKERTYKRKFLAAALAIFFGAFGAHKFYLGKTFTGLIYAIFCWTGISAFVGFIEGIRYIFMPVEDFYVQYCLDN